MEAAPRSSSSMWDYYTCLRDYPHYRNLWTADFVDNVGSWLSYVATLELVESFSGGSGLALSAVILVRFFPSLLLSPLAGVLADRCNRVVILVAAALTDAALVASLVSVRNPSQAPLLYALLTLQFSAIALQDPSRKAIVPVLVPESALPLATTLETFSWSITGAVGAAAGGVIASRLGRNACFLIDAGTYLVAAWCASKIPRSLGDPHAMDKGMRKVRSSAVEEVPMGAMHGALPRASVELVAAAAPPASLSMQQQKAAAAENFELNGNGEGPGSAEFHLHQVSHRKGRHQHQYLPEGGSSVQSDDEELGLTAGNGGKASRRATGSSGEMKKAADPEGAPLLGPRGSSGSSGVSKRPASVQSAPAAETGPLAGPTGGGGVTAAVLAACAGGWSSLIEGWRYLAAKENRDVAALVTMKGCGSVTWGAVDVLNVKYSELPGMQVAKDSATTLGLIFATVGVGCFVGPVVTNYVVPPRPVPLLWACIVAFGFLFAGSILMATATHLSVVLGASFVRAIGSANLWIYSTLILQLRVPNAILGRVCAAEMALYTVAEAASAVYGGAAFDLLKLSLVETTTSLAVMAGVVFISWTGIAWWQQRHLTRQAEL